MARLGWFGSAIAMVLALAAGSAGAQAPGDAPLPQPSGPVYVVTYFEVAPAASRKTAGLLRQFSSAARKEGGNVEFLALREITRPGRFALVEAWQDKAALDMHGAAMKALADKLAAAFASPFDARGVAHPVGGLVHGLSPAGGQRSGDPPRASRTASWPVPRRTARS